MLCLPGVRWKRSVGTCCILSLGSSGHSFSLWTTVFASLLVSPTLTSTAHRSFSRKHGLSQLQVRGVFAAWIILIPFTFHRSSRAFYSVPTIWAGWMAQEERYHPSSILSSRWHGRHTSPWEQDHSRYCQETRCPRRHYPAQLVIEERNLPSSQECYQPPYWG